MKMPTKAQMLVQRNRDEYDWITKVRKPIVHCLECGAKTRMFLSSWKGIEQLHGIKPMACEHFKRGYSRDPEEELAGHFFWCDHTMKKGHQGFTIVWEEHNGRWYPRPIYWSVMEHMMMFHKLPFGYKKGRGYEVHGNREPMKCYSKGVGLGRYY